MAFCDMKPVLTGSDSTGTVYVFGNVFAIYEAGAAVPTVYSWDMVKNASINRKGIALEFGKRGFHITYKAFSSMEEALRAVAVIEYQQGIHGFSYQHEKRLFPLKSMYREGLPGRESYTGEAMLDEAETAAAFIMLLNFKLMKFLWLVAILIMLVTFGVLQLTVGITRDNILYFIPISIAAGGIAALLINIIAHAIARGRYKTLSDADPASKQVITFVISRAGFAACESCVYESRDLVPWNEADYFIESDKMFIIYKGNQPLAYIPKRAFPKKAVTGVADIMSLNLEQR